MNGTVSSCSRFQLTAPTSYAQLLPSLERNPVLPVFNFLEDCLPSKKHLDTNPILPRACLVRERTVSSRIRSYTELV